ncbi:ABC transporter ATP-binding protein/permease [Patescibacteria group bacterium]|nr:ABC transporter ATP-binding protein/permease [Patescibacteria group bacterium]
MNTAVYRYLFRTYGRHFGYLVGFVTEIIRSLAMRVWGTIIMANVVANLAIGQIAAAKQNSLLFLIVYAAGAVIGSIGELSTFWTENSVYGRLSVGYFQKLTGKDMGFYRDHQSGYLVSLFRQYLDSAIELARFLRSKAVRTVITLGAPTVVLLVLKWQVGLLAFGIVAIQILYVIWTSSKANQYRALSHEAYRKGTGEASDVITNITAFKSSGDVRQTYDRFAGLAKEETVSFWLRRKTVVLLDLPRDLFTAAGVTAAFLITLSTSHGAGAIGLLVLTLTYMFQIIRSVSDLPGLIMEHDDLVTKVYPTLSYLTDVYETIRDPDKPKRWEVSNGSLTFSHLYFSYPAHSDKSREVPVFSDLNIEIRGGERVGIVGLSGAGKSTLASLIMRFDEVQSGSIAIDGTDIREMRQTDLHQAIAYVPQEPLLFHRSIRENIAYFNHEATEEDIVRAAKAAYAHDFITRLPDGYDSLVGERGVKLSGGQKQRVVIARAILKNARIMIFDEATSALDTESERIIHTALPEIIGKHTAIIIAHRLSTVAGLDRILVMHDGKIVEEGTHAELLAAGGRYCSLWQKQIGPAPILSEHTRNI